MSESNPTSPGRQRGKRLKAAVVAAVGIAATLGMVCVLNCGRKRPPDLINEPHAVRLDPWALVEEHKLPEMSKAEAVQHLKDRFNSGKPGGAKTITCAGFTPITEISFGPKVTIFHYHIERSWHRPEMKIGDDYFLWENVREIAVLKFERLPDPERPEFLLPSRKVKVIYWRGEREKRAFAVNFLTQTEEKEMAKYIQALLVLSGLKKKRDANVPIQPR